MISTSAHTLLQFSFGNTCKQSMSNPDRPPWEIKLRDAVAEEMAIVAERDFGLKELRAPLGGLIDVFGCTPETRELGRRRLVRELNRDALNLEAKKWLPADWNTGDNLYALTLMLWGVWEANTVPDYWDTLDIAGEQVAKMTRWNPALVMALLQGTAAGVRGDAAPGLTAATLAGQDDAAAAAWVLMSALADALRSDTGRFIEP